MEYVVLTSEVSRGCSKSVQSPNHYFKWNFKKWHLLIQHYINWKYSNWWCLWKHLFIYEVYQRRCCWLTGYQQGKWNQQFKFKSWIRSSIFCFILLTLEKTWMKLNFTPEKNYSLKRIPKNELCQLVQYFEYLVDLIFTCNCFNELSTFKQREFMCTTWSTTRSHKFTVEITKYN